MSELEPVLFVSDVWDGQPLSGVAHYLGVPHHFETTWCEEDQRHSEIYSLTPLVEETLALALEQWSMWLRWCEAHEGGHTGLEECPCLPVDRIRYDEIDKSVTGYLQATQASRIQRRGDFQAIGTALIPYVSDARVSWSMPPK